MNVAFPFEFDTRRRTAEVNDERHIHDLIEQLLFTLPGERVNRPDFGSGLIQLVFSPNSPELASATQFQVQGTLQQWLGDLIHVEAVEVTCVEAALTVTVRYIVRRTQQQHIEQFTGGVP